MCYNYNRKFRLIFYDGEVIVLKKYAIYKAETGYFYYRYCDTINDLKDSKFKDIITEEQLPVVLDNNGGYYKFDPKDLGFSEIIESDKEVPLSLEKMFFKNDENFKLGWISPDGDTYSCNFTNHTLCAEMIADKYYPDAKYPERKLGKAGWLKVIDSWDGTQRQHGQFVYSFFGKITKRQLDTLFDLGLYYNEEVQKLISDNSLDL